MSIVIAFESSISDIATQSFTLSVALTALIEINETNIIEINNIVLLIFKIALPPFHKNFLIHLYIGNFSSKVKKL